MMDSLSESFTMISGTGNDNMRSPTIVVARGATTSRVDEGMMGVVAEFCSGCWLARRACTVEEKSGNATVMA